MDLQLNRSKLKVSIYGEKFELTKPTLKEAKAYQKKIDQAEGDSAQLDVASEFLVSKGLKSELVEELELQHFLALSEALMGVKKN